MKHAIIPTDFSIRSLQPIHEVMNIYKGEQVRITMLHLVDIPAAIGDLLFRLRRMDSRFPIPAEFSQACEMMANKYADQVTGIKTQLQYGTTASYLENLLEGLGADAIFIQQGFELELPFEDSISMLPLIRKANYKTIETIAPRKTKSVGVSTISDLLLAGS